jgi:hypothetical protein
MTWIFIWDRAIEFCSVKLDTSNDQLVLIERLHRCPVLHPGTAAEADSGADGR